MTSHLRTATVALALGLASTGAASAEIFLKIPSVPGDTVQRGFEDQIAVTGASLNVASYEMPDPEGSGAMVRTPSMGPIMITKTTDRASPRLMMAARAGQPLGPLEISFTTQLRPGVEPALDGRWIVEGAQVTSYSVFPGDFAGAPQVETVEITYSSIRYQHFNRGGKGRTTTGMEEVTIEAPEVLYYGFEEGCG